MTSKEEAGLHSFPGFYFTFCLTPGSRSHVFDISFLLNPWQVLQWLRDIIKWRNGLPTLHYELTVTSWHNTHTYLPSSPCSSNHYSCHCLLFCVFTGFGYQTEIGCVKLALSRPFARGPSCPQLALLFVSLPHTRGMTRPMFRHKLHTTSLWSLLTFCNSILWSRAKLAIWRDPLL